MDIYALGSNTTGRPWNDDILARLTIQLEAYDGQVGVGSAVIPDELGTDDFWAARRFLVQDIGVTILDGFIADREQTRGLPLDPQLEHVYTIRDPNALLYGFIVYQVRPAETDVARILAFLAAYRPTWDTTWVVNANTSTMSAKTYRGDTGFEEVLTDTRELTGKNFFVHDKADGSGRCAHYHGIAQDQGHLATIQITDDPSQVDGITYFAPVKYPQKRRNAQQLFNRIVGTDQSGRRSEWIVESSRTKHDADGMYHEKLVEFEAQSQSELDAKVFQFAVEHHREATTFEVGVTALDATAMGKWRVGDRIHVTSDVLDLPDALSPYPIMHATITITKDDAGRPLPGLWDVVFELAKPIRVFRKARSTLPRILTPYVPGSALAYRTIWVNAQPSFASASSTSTTIAPVAGELLLAISAKQDIGTHTFSDNTGGTWTEVEDSANAAGSSSYAWKIATGSETSVTVTYSVASVQRHLAVVAITGGAYVSHATPGFATSGTTHALPSVAPGTGSPVIIVATAWNKQGFDATGDPANYAERSNVAADSGTDSSRHIITTRAIAAPSGSYTGTFVYAGALQGWVGGQIVVSGSTSVPVYGQKTCEQFTGNGTTTLRTLNFPYIAGSLEVTQDGLHAVVTETSPSAGTYTTTTATGSGKREVACYQATGGDGTGAGNPQPTPSSPSGGGSNIYDLGWFNVKDYGATGDGTTNDTVAIQAAITACAAAEGGTVWFPAGEYIISGALQDTGAFNAQLLLPNVAHSGVDHVVIRFKGPLRPGFHPLYGDTVPLASSYAVLKSTLTGATGTAAVISGGNNVSPPGSGGGNNLEVVIEDLICLGPDNPTFTFWNLIACQGGRIEGLQISTPGAYSGSPTLPTNANAYGIKLPQALFSNNTTVNGLAAGGFYTGVLSGELAVYHGPLVLGPTVYGIEIPATYYPSLILQLSATSVVRVVNVTGAPTSLTSHRFDILQYVRESSDGTSFETEYDLYDPSNYGSGYIRWFTYTTAGGGGIDTFLASGGTGMLTEQQGPTWGGATAVALDDLTDVTLTSPAANNVLRYNGTVWVNSAAIWRPLMDGAGNVITDGGTGEAIMALS